MPVQPHQIPPPEARDCFAFDTAASHLNRLAILAVMGARHEERLTLEYIAEAARAIRSTGLAPNLSRENTNYHCKLLQRAGLVETEGGGRGHWKRGQWMTIGLTEYGQTLGMAAVGRVLPLATRPTAPGLKDVYGTPRRYLSGDTPLQPYIHESLLARYPLGMSTTDLHTRCGGSLSNLQWILRTLTNRGVVEAKPAQLGRSLIWYSLAASVVNEVRTLLEVRNNVIANPTFRRQSARKGLTILDDPASLGAVGPTFSRLWFLRGACGSEDPKLFFSPGSREKGRPARIEAAKAICRRCEVVGPCLKSALEQDDQTAIRGGLLPEERAALSDEERAQALAVRIEP